MIRLARIALSLALAGSGLASGTGSLAQSGADTDLAQDRLAEREVFGFLPYWELSNAASIDMSTLTTLAWFGVEAGRDGRLIREEADGEPTRGWAGWTSDSFAAVRERARASGVRVVLTVERFSWSAAGKRETKQLLSDPEARRTLADEIIEAVTEADAGGVNLDFEPLPRTARGEFVRLVRQVRRAFDRVDPSLQLTFDLMPDVESFPLQRLVADDAADAAVLMGYEYRTPGSKVAGSVAPLRVKDGLDVRKSVQIALKKAPADKVILAMPWYGRAWSTRSGELGSRTRSAKRFLDPTTAFYRVSAPRAATAGRQWDAKQGSAWSVYRSRACETCPVSWRQLWYEDVDSVLAKVGLARRKGLRGVGIWALGYDGDRPELWAALRYGLDRPRDREVPAGDASIDDADVLGEQDGVPLVGASVTLALEASDGDDGSGLAFVRVSARGRLNDDGSLKRGTTFPAVDSLTISLPGATAVDEVFTPGAAAEPSPTPAVSPAAGPPSFPDPLPLRIRVQWRDIAGNWSTPIRIDVAYQPAAATLSE